MFLFINNGNFNGTYIFCVTTMNIIVTFIVCTQKVHIHRMYMKVLKEESVMFLIMLINYNHKSRSKLN